MTPSNTPITPQINNIADSGGNKHTVVPSKHTHSQSEVDGLTAALAGKIGIVSSPTAGHLPKLKSDGALEDSGIPINNLATQADLANINMSLAQKLGMFNMQQSVAGHLPVITSLGRLEDSGKGLSDLQTKLTFDTTPTSNSTNPVTSGGVKAAIDALTTSVVPIHQVAAILPKTRGQGSEYELQNWLGDGKMALVLQTARPVEVNIEATGADDAPDGTWSGSTDISFDLEQGIRTVKNIYDLMDAQLQNDYPGERIGVIVNWKISVYAKDTVPADTACLINFYNPTSAE